VRHGNRGTPVAVPLLTEDDGLRDRICDWQTACANHDRVFLGGGPLEIPAYHQLADPFSELMSQGRELAGEIEAAVGVKVYSYLLRHWGKTEAEQDRACPGCGQAWRAGSSPYPSREPFHRFHFCCDPCRLVSHVASISDVELAEIGSYQQGREICPCAEPPPLVVGQAVVEPTEVSPDASSAQSAASDALDQKPTVPPQPASLAADAVDRSEVAGDNPSAAAEIESSAADTPSID